MAVHNADIARLFDELADLLEVEGADRFRVRAYRNGAQTLRGLGTEVQRLLADGKDLTELPTIGDDLAAKIQEALETGTLRALEKERKNVPRGVADMMLLEGLGPKRARRIHHELGIETLDELREAADSGRVADLEGFGAKTQKKILDALAGFTGEERRFLRAEVMPAAGDLQALLEGVEGVGDVDVAGSYRRRKETVGDLDLLVTCEDAAPVMDAFTTQDDVARVASQGDTRSTVVLRNGLQVDLRVVPERSRGSALHYFTGSKAHNIALRRRAQDHGWKLNEYGLFDGNQRLAGKDEEGIYKRFGMAFIEPELREGRGELEAAAEGRLPDLVERSDLQGDLHVHTDASDGKDTLEAMVQAAQDADLAYVAITDHSPNPAIAQGPKPTRMKRRIEEIHKLDATTDGIRVLAGAEVDIHKDGGLDYPDEVLAELDLVVCSVHSHFRLDRQTQTDRILTAMAHDRAHILAHPTGRMLGDRDPIDVDMEALLDAAQDGGWAMEVDGQPARLDLDDAHVHQAVDAGVPLSLASDAHAKGQFDNLQHAVDQARRGWAGKDDVLNALPVTKMLKAVGAD